MKVFRLTLVSYATIAFGQENPNDAGHDETHPDWLPLLTLTQD